MVSVGLAYRVFYMAMVRGEPVIGFLEGVGDCDAFRVRVVREAVRPPYEFAETARQLYELGLRSVPLIAAAGFAVGLVMSMHTRASLERFGAEALIPRAWPSRWCAKPVRSPPACCCQAASARASAPSSAR